MTVSNRYVAILLGFILIGAPKADVYFEDSGAVSAEADRQADSVAEFWTKERMQQAKPFEAPESSRLISQEMPDKSPMGGEGTTITDPPVLVPGWSPQDDLPPATDVYDETQSWENEPLSYGTAPINPKDGPYGPFQRWSMQGKYLLWPRSIHGKIFFRIGNDLFVCSGTVIDRSTIATAGHCVSDGAQSFHSDVVFCPSYVQAGPNPQVGCWEAVSLTTSTRWHASGDVDYDYGCIVTDTTGTQINDKIGNVTGWSGVAYNLPSSQPELAFGYPAGAPFDGAVIQQVATTEWYEFDMVSGDQVSKYVGSDLTGGSSGGGWFVSWRHPNVEFPDTDDSTVTDASGAQNGPFLNGVNSHRRCLTNCSLPPTTTAGQFWQELGSPPFLDTAALEEASDIFAECFSHANNQ